MLTQQEDRVTRVRETHADAVGDVASIHAQHAHHRGGNDVGAVGLVVEADVTAGDRGAEGAAAVHQGDHGLELPHHARVFGAAEVEAVGDRDGFGTVTATLRYASHSANCAPRYGLR